VTIKQSKYIDLTVKLLEEVNLRQNWIAELAWGAKLGATIYPICYPLKFAKGTKAITLETMTFLWYTML
jgi:hypothetical protein